MIVRTSSNQEVVLSAGMSGMKDGKKKKPIEMKMDWKKFCLLKKLPHVIPMADVGRLSHLNPVIAFSIVCSASKSYPFDQI